MSQKHGHAAPKSGKVGFISTDQVILGFLIGVALIWWELSLPEGEAIVKSPIGSTLWTAVYLTMVVGWSKFQLPTFFTGKSQRLANFTMAVFCGFISLFFDSFAVVLLLSGMAIGEFVGKTHGWRGYSYTPAFRAHAFKVICALNALTFGGAFFIGELWGLPHFISSQMAHPIAGIPLVAAVGPMILVSSLVAAYVFPVKLEKVSLFTRDQVIAGAKIVPFLLLIIVNHRPILCLGVLFIVASLFRQMKQLWEDTVHEISSGAQHALGLIIAALVIQQIPGAAEWFGSQMHGPVVILWAAISSPFTGAMAPGSTTLQEFYSTLSYIMIGAPVLVSSSLVAIVVFKDTLHYDDLPPNMQKLHRFLVRANPFKRVRPDQTADEAYPFMAEMISYTLICLPFVIMLGLISELLIRTGGFVWIAEAFGIHIGMGANH